MSQQEQSNPQADVEAINHVRAAHIAALNDGDVNAWVAAFTNDGRLEWPDGRLPTNTAGGGMSEAYVHGFNLILEGVRQMRGTSVNQVKDAATCIVSNQGGIMTTHSTLILGH